MTLTQAVNLRPADPSDAGPMHELHTRAVRTTCAPHYAPEVIDGWLRGRSPEGHLPAIERDEMFVAEAEGRLIGFGHAVPGEVLGVFVDPPAQGKGVGRLITEHALERAKQSHGGQLELESTLNAVDFYTALGFAQVERSSVRRGDIEVPIVRMRYDA